MTFNQKVAKNETLFSFFCRKMLFYLNYSLQHIDGRLQARVLVHHNQVGAAAVPGVNEGDRGGVIILYPVTEIILFPVAATRAQTAPPCPGLRDSSLGPSPRPRGQRGRARAQAPASTKETASQVPRHG